MALIVFPFEPLKINEGFGWSEWRQGFHDGLDISAAQGTPLIATAAGRVLRYASDKDGAGIDIKCDDGTIVRNWHLSKFNVANGSYVQIGDIIGLTGGAPGTWGAGFSTGAHLHWGTKVNGVWVDPLTVANGKQQKPSLTQEGNEMRLVAGQPSNRRYALGELTYQELPMDQASHSAHIWESLPGGRGTGEPLVVDDADLDLEIGQIQKRRAQLAAAFKDLGL